MVGGPGALGTTANLPMPVGTTGDAYLAAVDDVVAPLAAWFGATWLLLSAGFDAHRADPLTGLGLSAGDYAELTAASWGQALRAPLAPAAPTGAAGAAVRAVVGEPGPDEWLTPSLTAVEQLVRDGAVVAAAEPALDTPLG